jgi:hypothetical protein
VGDSAEIQRRADRDATIFEVLRHVFFPIVKGKSADPFLFPTVAFVAGMIALLNMDGLSRGWGIVLVFVLLSQLVSGIVAGLLLRRALAFVHRIHPRLAWSLFVLAGVSMLVLAGAIKIHKLSTQRARETAITEVRETTRRAAEKSRVVESQAAKAEREARAALLERWRIARGNAIAAWRKALVADRALGARGVSPPMLGIQDDGKRVDVTNRSTSPACILLTRIATNESGGFERCAVANSRCVLVAPGKTTRLATLLARNPQSCLTGELEFRIGNVDHPEVSWWSESAFADFTEQVDLEMVYRWSDERLTAEVSRLEKLAHDLARAHR